MSTFAYNITSAYASDNMRQLRYATIACAAHLLQIILPPNYPAILVRILLAPTMRSVRGKPSLLMAR